MFTSSFPNPCPSLKIWSNYIPIDKSLQLVDEMSNFMPMVDQSSCLRNCIREAENHCCVENIAQRLTLNFTYDTFRCVLFYSLLVWLFVLVALLLSFSSSVFVSYFVIEGIFPIMTNKVCLFIYIRL